MQPSTTIPGRNSSAARKRAPRRRVVEAFRRMAKGVDDKAAYGSTVRFYRSGGQEWTKQLA